MWESFYRIYLIILIGGVVVITILAYYAWRRRSAPGAIGFIGMLFSVNIWLISSIGTFFSNTVSECLGWNIVGYLGVVTLPVMWLHFALLYTGRRRWINKVRMGLLFIVPAIVMVSVLQGWMWEKIVYSREGAFWHQEVVFSFWLWIEVSYSYTLLIGGSIMVFIHYIQETREGRRQTALILFGFLIPFVFNAVYSFGLIPQFPFDLTPLGFLISCLSIGRSFFYYRLFDLAPIARDKLVDNMEDGMLVLNHEQQVVDLNPAARRYLHCTFRQAFLQPIEQFIPVCAGVLRPEQSLPHQMTWNPPHSASVTYLLQIVSLLSPTGALGGYLITIHDISILRQAELELQKALAQERELSEIRSRFVSTVSHEFRTPLSTILSSAELLENYSHTWAEEKKNTHLRRIEQSAKSIATILDGIAIINRAELSKPLINPQNIEMCAYLRDTIEEMRLVDKNQHELHFTCSCDRIILNLDERLLRPVLVNLFENAIKYSPVHSRIETQLVSGDLSTTLTISDQGIGIPQNNIPHLGEIFYRGENVDQIQGTGLGLNIVSKSLEFLGGSITFKSRVNKGTQVIVNFPKERVCET